MEYRIGRIFRYTYKHLEHLRHDVLPETDNCERSDLSGLFNGADFLYLYRISGFECVCQKNARLRVFTACAKFLRALI